mmetsp:Transcript_25088/g.49126  ORF Transcript_25088/g.49126 Transcript_25088/m.49126 type:complete len:441 (-) Transcript_25088:464-1786(-)
MPAPLSITTAGGEQSLPVALGRYQVDNGPPLGTGGWCLVRRAKDTLTGQTVAVKTYTDQAVKQLGDDCLAARLQAEVSTFQKLGVGPSGAVASGRPDPRRLRNANPRQWLVNLLDFSSNQENGCPGKAADGKFYTVLELADICLASWIKEKALTGRYASLDDVREIAAAISRALQWLHSLGMCHLDVKPENIMRFGGGSWKLIDLQSCLPINPTGHGDSVVGICEDDVTPLYASPEVACWLLAGPDRHVLLPSPAMDAWAAGVVLLDVLAHASALQETKSGFDTVSLFYEEELPCEQWYQWLADQTPLNLDDLLGAAGNPVNPGSQLLAESVALRNVLQQLLAKDPAQRLTMAGLQGHAFLVDSVAGGRVEVEKVFQAFCERSGVQSLSCAQFSSLLAGLGVCCSDAEALAQACGCMRKGHATFRELIDFLYNKQLVQLD